MNALKQMTVFVLKMYIFNYGKLYNKKYHFIIRLELRLVLWRQISDTFRYKVSFFFKICFLYK